MYSVKVKATIQYFTFRLIGELDEHTFIYVSLTVSLVPLEWLPPMVKCVVDRLTFLLKVMLSVLYF